MTEVPKGCRWEEHAVARDRAAVSAGAMTAGRAARKLAISDRESQPTSGSSPPRFTATPMNA